MSVEKACNFTGTKDRYYKMTGDRWYKFYKTKFWLSKLFEFYTSNLNISTVDVHINTG